MCIDRKQTKQKPCVIQYHEGTGCEHSPTSSLEMSSSITITIFDWVTQETDKVY